MAEGKQCSGESGGGGRQATSSGGKRGSKLCHR